MNKTQPVNHKGIHDLHTHQQTSYITYLLLQQKAHKTRYKQRMPA